MSQISEILPILFFSTMFAGFSHAFSTYDKITEKYIRKDWIFFGIMVIMLIIFAGLREGYNDTLVYTSMYEEETKTLKEGLLNSIDWTKLGDNPGFWLTMGLMKSAGFTTNTFILLFSFATLSIYYWFVRKYTDNILFSSFLMFVLCYTFTFAAIKQCIAMAISLIAVDMCLKRKYIFFVIFILLAVTFHPYAIMFIVCPLLRFRPWTRYTRVMLIAFAFVGVTLQFFVGRIFDITTMIGETYSSTEFSGEGINPFRVVVHLAPLVLALFLRKDIKSEECSDADSLFFNLTILNGGLMFVALFGTANYFGRLANYFSIFPTITLPWLFKFIDKRYKYIILIIAVLAYLIFFYYDNTISGMGTFNEEFYRITLWQYFERIGIA